MEINEVIERLYLPLVHRNCITVIGSQAILQCTEDNNFTGDSQILLLKTIAKQQRFRDEDIKDYKTENDFIDLFHKENCRIGFTNFTRIEEDKNQPVVRKIKTDLENKRISEDIWANGLITLLQWNRVVFTTATDCCIEYAMKQAYNDDKAVEIFDIRMDGIISKLATRLDEINKNPYDAPPILVYLLGRTKTKNDDYSEASYVDDILKLATMMDGQRSIKDFIRAKDKSLLMVGTQMDIWRFRFIWHLLTNNGTAPPIGNASIVFSQPGYIMNDFNCFCEQTQGFLNVLGTQLESDKAYEEALKAFNGTQTIFVSYKHSDYKEAKGVVDILKTENYPVWFDETSLLPGDKYLEVIQKALEQTKYVVIILTKNVATDLKELDSHIDWQKTPEEINVQMTNLYKEEKTCFYLIHEWRYALSKGKKIIPIHTYDYPLGDIQKIFNKVWGAKEEKDMMSVKAIPSEANDLKKTIKNIVK